MVRTQPPSAGSETSITLEEDRAVDRTMAWLALYIPAVGTSVVLHVALVLLAVFMIPFAARWEPALEGVRSRFDPPKRTYRPEPRPPRRRPAESRGVFRPQPEGYFKRSPLKIRGVGVTPEARNLSVIGIGSNRRGGGPPGWGTTFSPAPPVIFRRLSDRKIVYLVDRSGSMTDSIDYVKFELKERIAELDESSAFHVIFFSSGPPVEMPTRRLVAATERNKRLAFAFIDRVVAGGETDPSHAFARAFAVEPEVICFLTDGDFDEAVVDQVRRLNAADAVTVHTIGFLYRPNEGSLRAIADQNGGQYTFVSEADLAMVGT